MIPRVRTSRLLLREWQEGDFEPYAALNADSDVMAHFPATLTREQSDAHVASILARWDEHGYGLWAVERLDTGEFIGFVGLALADFDADFTPAVEVGWRLARPHWGHGFATEAGLASLAHAFGELGVPEVVSFTARTNTRSVRVMERLGLVYAGEFDHPRVPEGHPVRPHVLYRISAEQWRRQR